MKYEEITQDTTIEDYGFPEDSLVYLHGKGIRTLGDIRQINRSQVPTRSILVQINIALMQIGGYAVNRGEQ